MHEVAGKHGVARARGQSYRCVAGRVAGRRLEFQPVVDAMRRVDQLGLAGGDDRQHAVVDTPVLVGAALALVLPEIPLLAGEHVARVREGRDPHAIHQPRVPADMIHMHVRDHDVVHLLGPDAGGGEIVEEGAGATMPDRIALARLVVAHARVDQHQVFGRAHDPGADARAEIVRRLVPEMRLEPSVMSGDRLWRRLRQHRRRRKRRTPDLDHAREAHVAQRQRRHRLVSFTSRATSPACGTRPACL